MLDLLLGLDIGTTAVKAAVYDQQLHLIASANVLYQRGLESTRRGWAEHDPDDLWQGVVAATRAVVATSAGHGVVQALAASTQGATTFALDRHAHHLRPAISWMDTRVEGLPLQPPLTPERVYRKTGWWSSTGLPLHHIRWLRRHEPEVFNAAARFVFVNDYAMSRMTGEYAHDPSNAGITMLYNLISGDWDEELLAEAGITRRQISPLRPSGQVVGRLRAEAAGELGLRPGVVVANGAHDQYCTALGAGVVQPGATLIGSGTAWALLFATAQPLFDDRQIFHPAPHAAAGHWGALSSIPSAGASVEWYLRQMIGRTEAADKYRWLNEGAAQAPAGSRDLLFIPLLGGFYSAAGDEPVRGAWIGLTLAHSSNEMSRSIMEGVAYEVRRLVELARAAGVTISAAKMLGGATSSPVWPQIVADVLDVPLSVPTAAGAACRGAAILAGVGLGVFRDALDGCGVQADENTVTPQASAVERYRHLYPTYCNAFACLGDTFAALNQSQG